MVINSKSIYNLAFFSIIFMYFKLIPVNIETQPVIVIALIPLFLLLNKKMLFKINKEDRLLFIHLLIILFYYFIAVLFGVENSFLNLLKLILGPISYLFLLKNVDLLSIKTLKIMTVLLFFTAIVYLTHFPIIYNILDIIVKKFLNRYAYTSIGARGMSILTPEPSYFVYFAMLLLYSFDFVEGRQNLKENHCYRVMLYFMCFLTKSAIVYLFLLVYLLFKYLFINKKININKHIKKLIAFSVILVFLIIIIKVLNINIRNNRFYQVINNINFTNIIDTFFYKDESAGFRFIMNSIYILSIFIKPFGFGLGGMEKQWSYVAHYFNINYSKNGMFIHTYNSYSNLVAQAYIPNIIGTIGIFSIFLITFLYKRNRLGQKQLKYSLLFCLTLFLWLLQSNMFNPVFWILIGFCKYCEEERENSVI